MRITFGQNNQYYQYGSQRSKNQSYKEPEKKHTVRNIATAIFGGSCIGFALLKRH